MSLFPDPQSSLGFPQPLAEKYRPARIAGFIGLEKQKKVLSAFAKRPVSCAWLLIGGSGLGKTTIARALADELQADTHFIPSQKCNVETVESTWRLCWNIPHAGLAGWHVVICDEAPEMSKAAQLALLSKLDSTDPAPQTIWIFTGNNPEKLEKPFFSRCRILEFSGYGMRSDLASFLADVWRKETGTDGSLDWDRLAKEAQNNVRDALNRLEVELLAA